MGPLAAPAIGEERGIVCRDGHFDSSTDSFGFRNRPFRPRIRHFGSRNRSFGQRNRDFGSCNPNFASRTHHFGVRNRDIGSRNRHFGMRNREFGQRNRFAAQCNGCFINDLRRIARVASFCDWNACQIGHRSPREAATGPNPRPFSPVELRLLPLAFARSLWRLLRSWQQRRYGASHDPSRSRRV